MAQVTKYSKKADYAADAARLKSESAVSYIDENKAVVYDGVNCLVENQSAYEGDLVVFDKVEARIRFVKARTLVKAQLAATLVPVGVVFKRLGATLLCMSITQYSERWGHPFEAMLSGIANAAAGSLTVKTTTGANTDAISVNWAAGSTLASIADKLTAAFATAAQEPNRKWTATATDNGIILSHSWYISAQITEVTGAVLAAQDDVDYQTTYAYIDTTEYVRRKNGVNSYFAGFHLAKFVEYYSVNGTVPTSNIPLGSSTIVNKDSFENLDFCADLRAKYATYQDYLDGEHMAQFPSNYGTMLRDGKEHTELLAARLGTIVRGAQEPRYPAAHRAHTYGVSVEGFTTGLEAGAWHLPSPVEMYHMMSTRRLNAADTKEDLVNDTLVKMGYPTCYGNGYYPWTVGECSSSSAFVFYGDYGHLSSGIKCDSLSVRPVTAL